MAAARVVTDSGGAPRSFADLGYVLCNVDCRPAESGDHGVAVVATKAVQAGAPLLAIPLDRCWTASAARRCAAVAAELGIAAARAGSANRRLLQADETWIICHLLHARRSAKVVGAGLSAHLASLDRQPPHVLQAWGDNELNALSASSLAAEASRQEAQINRDFAAIVQELGEASASRLGLEVSAYRWARQVLLQFGVRAEVVGAPSRRALVMLVPGLELLMHDSTVAGASAAVAGAHGDVVARVRLEADGAGTDSGFVVVSALCACEAGGRVVLKNAVRRALPGLGFCRPFPGSEIGFEDSPGEFAEVNLRFGYAPGARQALEGLASSLDRSTCPRPAELAGDCIAVGSSATLRSAVQVVREADGHTRADAREVVCVTFRVSALQLLPGGREAMLLLGNAIVHDPEQLSAIVEEEQSEIDVFGEDASVRRGLRALRRAVEAAVAAYPASPPEDSQSTRAACAARIVVGEQAVLRSTLEAIDVAASNGALARERAAQDRLTKVEVEVAAASSAAFSLSAGCSAALTEVAQRFRELSSVKKLRPEDGQGLQEELQVLRACLSSASQLLVTIPLPCVDGTVLRAEDTAKSSLLDASSAEQDWRVACLDEVRASGAADASSPMLDAAWARSLRSRVSTRLESLDFEGAQEDVCRLIASGVERAQSRSLARDCVRRRAAHMPDLLAVFASGGRGDELRAHEATLQFLQKRLQVVSYTTLRLPCLEHRRLAYLPDLFDEVAGWSDDAKVDAFAADAVGGEGSMSARRRIADLLRLFALNRPLMLRRTIELLGPEAVSLLLRWSIFVGYTPKTGRLLSAAEAESQVGRRGAADEVEVFASIALLPFEGVIVAADFDGISLGRPVPFPAQDTVALLPAVCPAEVQMKRADTRILDASSDGCGALGLVALRRFAGNAVFFDDSGRSLRFCRFAAAVNGFSEQAAFVSSEPGAPADALESAMALPFDAIFATRMVVVRLRPMLPRSYLKPRGWLVATGGPDDLRDFADDGAANEDLGVRGLLLDGSTQAGADHNSDLETAVLLLCASPRDAAAPPVDRQQVAVRTVGAISGASGPHLAAEVGDGLASLMKMTSVEEMITTVSAAGKVGDDQSIYDLDWAEDAAIAGEPPMKQNLCDMAAQAEHLNVRRMRTRRAPDISGMQWGDVSNAALSGWSAPIMCDVFWQETPKPEIRDRLPKEQIALVEADGCRLPSVVEAALRRGLGCTARYAFDRAARRFDLSSGGLDDGYDGPIAGTDVLVVPLPSSAHVGAAWDAPAVEVLSILQAVADIIETEKRYITVMFLTCGASGPPLSPTPIVNGAEGDVAGGLAAACSIRGVIRVARLEMPMLSVLCVDTDDFREGVSGEAVARQVMCELEATDGTMEVAYRQGVRYAPRMRLSPRSRIREGHVAPRLDWTGRAGVAVITGGLGGLGIVTAEALVEAGVTTVVLISRSGRVTRDGQGLSERLEALVASGTRLVQELCDTSSEQQVKAMLERVRSLGLLRIVVHAAGILDDKMFLRQTAESMRSSFGPKADGAWYLHKHTLKDPVQSFICYSSIAANYGFHGQANYAASNTFMDELCRWRVARGLPGVSVQWPGIKDVGMAAFIVAQDVDLHHSVGPDTVKRVVRQLVAGSGRMEPVQAVCPAGQIVPRMRQHVSLMEPLLEAVVQGAAVVDSEVRCRPVSVDEPLRLSDLAKPIAAAS